MYPLLLLLLHDLAGVEFAMAVQQPSPYKMSLNIFFSFAFFFSYSFTFFLFLSSMARGAQKEQSR